MHLMIAVVMMVREFFRWYIFHDAHRLYIDSLPLALLLKQIRYFIIINRPQ